MLEGYREGRVIRPGWLPIGANIEAKERANKVGADTNSFWTLTF